MNIGVSTRSMRKREIEERKWTYIPCDLYVKIFSLLPAEDVAASCALVRRSWRYYSRNEELWKGFCEKGGLQASGDNYPLLTWRSLYAEVFGKNLIGSPHFKRIDRVDAKLFKARFLTNLEPKYRIYPDWLYSEDERHDEPRSYCHWMSEGGARCSGDGVIRECPPLDCQPFPGAPEEPVLATSYHWGKVHQFVDLMMFPRRFLDSSPPLVVSAWYAGRKGSIGLFRIEVGLRDMNNMIIFSKISGDFRAQPNKWKEAKEVIFGYPTGMRSIVVKFGGRSMGRKSGFHGTKYTAVRLKFATVTEAVVQRALMSESSTLSIPPSMTEEFDTRSVFPKRA